MAHGPRILAGKAGNKNPLKRGSLFHCHRLTLLARLLAEITPPSALALSTPFVRIPITDPPQFPQADLEAHAELAVRRWHHGWTRMEERRRLGALDADRETRGQRYANMVREHSWLMLALERERVGWEAALYLVEQLTRPMVDWFVLDQAATNGAPVRAEAPGPPIFGDARSGKPRVVTPYRRVAVAVLADIGSAWLGSLLGELPDDNLPGAESRDSSQLVGLW